MPTEEPNWSQNNIGLSVLKGATLFEMILTMALAGVLVVGGAWMYQSFASLWQMEQQRSTQYLEWIQLDYQLQLDFAQTYQFAWSDGSLTLFDREAHQIAAYDFLPQSVWRTDIRTDTFFLSFQVEAIDTFPQQLRLRSTTDSLAVQYACLPHSTPNHDPHPTHP